MASGLAQSRRYFFRNLASEALCAAHLAPQPMANASAAGAALRLPSTERAQMLDALEYFVDRYGGRMPRTLFHRIEVGAGCAGHRVCAVACPTRALRPCRDPAGGQAGVAFDVALCIGCGLCAASCPEQALSLVLGGGAAQRGPRVINQFEMRTCGVCGDEFPARAGDSESLCDRCRKARRLARAGFQQLFGARRMAGDQ
jgi:formate hydrogenlyase subunit 6/NADH:ubiquinone oxidoreductase subunit I